MILEASQFVSTVQKRQGIYISCIEEIAYNRGFIDSVQLLKTKYGGYLCDTVKSNNKSKLDIINFESIV